MSSANCDWGTIHGKSVREVLERKAQPMANEQDTTIAELTPLTE
jgi:hypothetical protein